jgi:hypothetical protein
VHGVAGREVVVGVQVEPPPLDGVPGDRQALQAPAGELDEVLLERLDAEHEGHRILGDRAVRTLGAHEERPVAPGESGRHAVVLDDGVVEVTEHRVLAHRLHGQIMVRADPPLELAFVALGAHGVVDERRRPVVPGEHDRRPVGLGGRRDGRRRRSVVARAAGQGDDGGRQRGAPDRDKSVRRHEGEYRDWVRRGATPRPAAHVRCPETVRPAGHPVPPSRPDAHGWVVSSLHPTLRVAYKTAQATPASCGLGWGTAGRPRDVCLGLTSGLSQRTCRDAASEIVPPRGDAASCGSRLVSGDGQTRRSS